MMSLTNVNQLAYLAGFVFLLHQTEATRKATCNGWTLKAPEEGSFQCTPLGVTISMPGTRCTLYCDAGYRAQQEVLVCSETGGWVPTNTPECLVDSTMTLVIVLSIVGSIIIIFGLSVLYARTSKRCRGKRRRLEDEDPETGRATINDTSTYYGQMKRLKRKRRLQAERQRQLAERQKRKEDPIEKSKPVSKQPLRRLKKDDKKQIKSQTRVEQKDKRKTPKDVTRLATKATKERRKVIPKPRLNRKQPPTRVKEKRSTSQTKTSGQKEKSKSFTQRMNEIFCMLCLPKKKANEKVRSKTEISNEDVKIISISEPTNVPESSRKPSTNSSSLDSTSSSSDYSSSSSSSSADEEEEVSPPKQAKHADDSQTPTSRAKKPPHKPPPPATKKPPPRPPAPKILQNKPQKASSDTLDSSENSPKRRSSEDVTPPTRHGISSGYSSEGDRHKRRRGVSESGIRRYSDDEKTLRPYSAITESDAKRMEILSPGPLDAEKITGNPYEDYPSALSYRQYQNFENDYRRTTGDYHPQYSNVKLIPIQTTKKKTEKEEKERKEKEEAEKEAQRKAKIKPSQGGVKYISIDEEDGEKDGEEKVRSNRKQAQRYEDPAARDRRRHSPDYHKRNRSNKHPRKEKSSKSKDLSKRDRKREIEGERIIDDGKRSRVENRGQVDRKYHSEKESKRSGNKTKDDKHRCSDKSKNRKRGK